MTSNQAAIEAVYRAEGTKMWRSLVACYSNRDLADEAVAEAFAQALRRGDELRDPTAWIWKSAFRIAGGLAKNKQRPDTPDTLGGQVWVVNEERDFALADALRSLTPLQRECVVLRHVAGWNANEIANHMDSTPGSVRVQIHKGLDRLRAELGSER